MSKILSAEAEHRPYFTTKRMALENMAFSGTSCTGVILWKNIICAWMSR